MLEFTPVTKKYEEGLHNDNVCINAPAGSRSSRIDRSVPNVNSSPDPIIRSSEQRRPTLRAK